MPLTPEIEAILRASSKDEESFRRLVELFDAESRRQQEQRALAQAFYSMLISLAPDVAVSVYDRNLQRQMPESGAPDASDSAISPRSLLDTLLRDEGRLLAALNGETTRADVTQEGRNYRIYTHPLYGSDHTIIGSVVLAFDVTSVLQNEAERLEHERLQNTLQLETELSELKTALITRISHEFRNPLAVIQTAAELLERYIDRMSNEDRQRRTRQIQAHVHYLTELLNEIGLLVGGSLRPPTVDYSFDLTSLCQDVTDLMARTIGMGRTFQTQARSSSLFIASDIDLVRLVLRHLLTDTVMRSTSDEVIDVILEEHEDRIVVSICCTLIVDSADATLNELLYHLDRSTPSGTELRMVKDALQLVGGDLEITVDAENGRCYLVSLPRRAPRPQPYVGMFG